MPKKVVDPKPSAASLIEAHVKQTDGKTYGPDKGPSKIVKDKKVQTGLMVPDPHKPLVLNVTVDEEAFSKIVQKEMDDNGVDEEKISEHAKVFGLDKEQGWAEQPGTNIITKHPEATMEVKYPDGTTKAAHVVGPAKHFSEPPCTVGFNAKYKKNMGNYESAEVGVFISVPCAHAEVNDVYDFAVNWVDDRMNSAMEKLGQAKS
jgi:hypothetical protein